MHFGPDLEILTATGGESWLGYIAQIGPLSFQAAIEHKPRQMR